jgi:hypothetical protein
MELGPGIKSAGSASDSSSEEQVAQNNVFGFANVNCFISSSPNVKDPSPGAKLFLSLSKEKDSQYFANTLALQVIQKLFDSLSVVICPTFTAKDILSSTGASTWYSSPPNGLTIAPPSSPKAFRDACFCGGASIEAFDAALRIILASVASFSASD